MPSTCYQTDDLRAFLAGELPVEQEARVAQHVQTCRRCEAAIEQLSDDAPTRRLLAKHRLRGQDQSARPDDLGELRERLHMLGWFSGASLAEGLSSGGSTVAEGGDATQQSGGIAPHGNQKLEPPPAPRVGKFEIVQPIGSGGFGVVYLARDSVLQRQVALKLARSTVLADPGLKGRFMREAEALGRLQHPHIVPVFEAGESDGTCYLAVGFCDGPTLEQWLRESPPVEPRLAARIAWALAGAVEHAHQHGILHRDIKPSNVLLDKIGPPQSEPSEQLPFTPKLTDFGLAKIAEQPSESTLSGVVLGTAQYMAPEQAAGLVERIGPPTDVYSLGAVLYEMLIGRPPIRGATSLDTLRRVLIDEPTPPGKLAAVPDDLGAIAMKCLDKSPTRRYATAGELAADLQRFLAGRPTLARPLGRGERAVRWVRRNRAASLVASLVAVVLILGGGLFLYDQRLSHVRSEIDRERAEVKYAGDVYEAGQRFAAGDVVQTADVLKRQIPTDGQPDLRGLEWHYLWSQTTHDAFARAHASAGDIYQIRRSPDKRQLAAVGKDGSLRLFAADTLAEQAVLSAGSAPFSEINGVAWSPDGSRLATVDDNGYVRLWNAKERQLAHTFHAHEGRAFQVVFADGGKLLITCAEEHVIRLWNSATGEPAGTLEGHTGAVEAVALQTGETGDILASASEDGTAIVWDLPRRQPLFHLRGHDAKLSSICFSPGGKLLATGGQDRAVCLWDRATGKQLSRGLHRDGVQSVEFTGGGRRLVAGDRGGTIRNYRVQPRDAADGGYDLLLDTGDDTWHAHEGRIWSLAALPEGEQFISAGQDGRLRAWGRGHSARRAWRAPGPDSYERCEYSRDAAHLFAIRELAGLEAFDPKTGEPQFLLPDSQCEWNCLAVLYGRGQAALGSETGEVVIWDWRTRKRLHSWNVGNVRLHSFAYSTEANLLAVLAYAWEDVRLYNPDTGDLVATLPAQSCTDMAISPDGQRLAVDEFDSIVLYELKSFGRVRVLHGHAGGINDLAYSPDGRWLASAANDRSARLWTAAGQFVTKFSGHGSPVTAVAFTPDSRSLVTAAEEERLKIFHVATLRELIDIPTGMPGVRCVAISPDGQQLAVVGSDYSLALFGHPQASADE